jgi:hypothetical protein
MKKFLTGFLALFLSATLCMAQAPAATKKPAKAKTTQQDTKPLKKDGTPDKRFKENKETAGPKKKDGTADLRYKANKKAAKKS